MRKQMREWQIKLGFLFILIQILTGQFAFSLEPVVTDKKTLKKIRILLIPWEKKDPKKPKLSLKSLTSISLSIQKSLAADSSIQTSTLSDEEIALFQSGQEKTSFTEKIVKLIRNKQMDFQGIVEVSLEIQMEDEEGKPKKTYELFFRFHNFEDERKSSFSILLAPSQVYQEKNGLFTILNTEDVGKFLASSMDDERKGKKIDTIPTSPEPLNHDANPPKQNPTPSALPNNTAVTTSVATSAGSDISNGQKPVSSVSAPKKRDEDDEDPLHHLRKTPSLMVVRYPWFSAFDIRAGYAHSIRRFSVENREFLPYSGSHGIFLAAELYPFSFSSTMNKHLKGLGIRGSFLMPFWRNIQTTNMPGGPPNHIDQVQEVRADAAIHWRSHFFEKAFHPELEVELLYGYQSINLQTVLGMGAPTLPSVTYQSIGGDVGGRIFLSRFVELGLGIAIAKLLQLGPDIESIQNYGPGTGFLWRARSDLGINIHGFTLGARAFYERKQLSFDGAGQKPVSGINPMTVRSAADDSIGIMATIGYQFSPVQKPPISRQ